MQSYQNGRRYVPSAYTWLTLSAILSTIPLYFSQQCWLVFVAYVPLFYAALVYYLTFYHGFWWGLLCWAGQLYALFFVVYEHGCGTLRMLIPLILIVYCATYSAGLFYATHRLSAQRTIPVRAGIWVICMTMYYGIMRYAALWIIGLCAGYPLALPLLPLAECPHFLAALPYVGSIGLMVCLFLSSMGVAYFMVTKKPTVLLISICAMIPFCIGWFAEQATTQPKFVRMCVLVKPPAQQAEAHPRDRAQDINACINAALAQKPAAQVIIMPESSYPFALNTYADVIALWSINALHKGQLLVIGSYYQEENELYNGIYGISKCRVIFNYVKNYRMPFTEYIPFPWSMVTGTHMLFLRNKQGFSSKKSEPVLSLTPDYSVCPALCSEFFFDAYDQESKLPVLALVNDGWFSCSYIRRLMYLCARYTALSHSRDIIYSSYSYGIYIDKKGNEWEL